MPSARQCFSHRLLWMALLLSLGIGALSARTLWTLRNDEWNYALQANANLVNTLSQSLQWTLDAVDQSLQGVVQDLERLPDPTRAEQVRKQVQFDGIVRMQAV